MAAIDLKNLGVSIDGRIQIAKATIGATAGANVDVQFDAQETLPVFNVPAGVVVLDMFAYTRTGWTASVTMTAGDGTAAAGFLASAKIAPTVAQTDGLFKRTTQATADTYAGGKLYLVADTIDVVVGGATPVVGETDLYVVYLPVTGDNDL